MTFASYAGSEALEALKASLSSEDRDLLDTMERVKNRTLRTNDRDGKAGKAFSALLLDLVTRIDASLPLGPGNRAETRALVITGRTGAGKSSLIGRMISGHPAFPGYGVPQSGCKAITVLTPSPCNPKALGLEILRVLGYPMAAERSVPIIWAKVRERLEFLGKYVLHLDELHNVLENANKREIKEIRKLLKGFLVSPTWPVVLILSGLPEIIEFFEGTARIDETGRRDADTKGELRRRGQFVHLPSLRLPDDTEMIAEALHDIGSISKMNVAPNVKTTIVPRLIHAAAYELGTTMQLIHEAVWHDLNRDLRSETLGLQEFKSAYEARTGCADEVNPFVSPNWRKIDCTLVLKQSRAAAEAATYAGERR